MPLTATHINYFHICHRKLWLFSNGIQMEHNSGLVALGKHLEETTYKQRPEKGKQIELEGIKIDYYDATKKVVYETKKTNAYEAAHKAQIKYYLYVLSKNGVQDASGILEYPKQRKTIKINALTKADLNEIKTWEITVNKLTESESVPDKKTKKSQCKNCSYFDFCWIEE